MKIAVISDIHGNMEAFNAVLEDIKTQECEQIFVLGDYAMAGPEPTAVIDWFFEREADKNIVKIQGNTDYMLANYSNEIYNDIKEKSPVMAEALRNDYMIINPIQKNYLNGLPPQKEIEIEGVKFLLVHGSPRKNNEDILPDLEMSVVEDIISGVNADVILCGHTHIPCGFQTSKKQTVVNVGSVGRPFADEPKACYLKITVSDGKCLFEHRLLDYNKEEAASKLRARKFIGSDKLANTLINPSERHF